MMPQGYIITGTGTDVGKTVFAAMLTLALGYTYWKPTQSGTEGGTDTETVKRLTGLPAAHFLPEKYVLTQPLSPHRAAEIDGVEIDVAGLTPPASSLPLLIEGAGGLLVPLTRDTLFIDVFKRWQMPVILCAHTGLGTINHTLLSVEALKARGLPLHGIAFIGADNPDNIGIIREFSGAKVLGRLPHLDALNRQTLEKAFAENFRKEDFSHGQPHLAPLHAARAG